MSRGFRKKPAAALIAATLLGGCVQATRHSNTMVFGTNTVFGIDAGQNANSVPSVTVGYKRQEAVIMPLVANTKDNGQYQEPCPISPQSVLEPGQTHPCVLVGSDGKAIDTYSVLASFGAQFEGDGTRGTASGGLAQFFSTGVAAQALAIRGGAALVATGRAAERQNAEEVAPALAALVGDPKVVERTRQVVATNETSRSAARAYLESLQQEAEFATRFEKFAATLGFAGFCAGLNRAQCLARVEDRGLITDSSPTDLDAAVAAAKTGA